MKQKDKSTILADALSDNVFNDSKQESPNNLRSSLLEAKIASIKAGFIVSDDFISEIESFAKRNTIVKVGKDKHFCHNCMKAHIIKKARELELPPSAIKPFLSKLEGEEGHNGYYLDEEDLIRL